MIISKTLIIILLILILADKGLTLMVLKEREKIQGIDVLKAEKNPIARWLFSKLGLFWGSVAMIPVQIITILFFLKLMTFVFNKIPYTASNPLGIAWYLLLIILTFVVGNNLYFYLKTAGKLP
jgi:hypothetical protein